MREYIITIDDWFFKSVHERYTHFFGCPIEEIVRCRDCKHYKPWLLSRPENGGDCVLNKVEVDVPPDGFCAWGERRTDDN